MVTVVASNPKQRLSQNPKRPALLPSHSNNAPPRRPKAREVTSRYLSLSTSSSSTNSSSSTTTNSSSVTSGSSNSSRRSQSPLISRGAAASTPKSSVKERAVSAERRRPAATTTSNVERMLTTSIRTLSVSFQGESFSLPVNKVKPPPTPAGVPGGLRKGTPERRKAGATPVRDQRENSKPSDQQHRWPGRLRGQNSSFLTRSLDCCDAERGKLNGSGGEFNELGKCMADELDSNKFELNGIKELDTRSILSDHLISDSEYVFSESTPDWDSIRLKGEPRGFVVPARFWQELNKRGIKAVDPPSPVSNYALTRKDPPKLIVSKKFQNDSPLSSPCSGLSPARGGARLASPSKALTSSTGALVRGVASPTRTRNGVVNNLMNDNNICSTPSMLSFAADVRRAKLGEKLIVDAHNLRLLHNRNLQWRLANARVENVLSVQNQAAERSLYKAWASTSKLRQSVKSKRIELQLLRHNLKIYSILKQQEPHLGNWDLMDGEYCNSLSGAIVALETSTIRLPVVNCARADVQKVQEAISSAVDVMQAMASSICSLVTKVEQRNLLVSELSNISARERGLLDEFKDFLSTTFIPLQVKYCSLRTHVLQIPQNLTKKV